MTELSFVLTGQNAEAAADELTAVLQDGDQIAIRRKPAEALPEADRKSIDPIALTSLILSIPGAALAVTDIVDRIKKRRKAQSIIDTAKRLSTHQQTETHLLLPDGTARPIADLNPDQLLDLSHPPTKP